MRSVPFIYTDDPAYPEEMKILPSKWAICPCCHGEGNLHPTYTMEEFMEANSEEEREDYLAGAYDRRCDDCGGTGKIKIIDEDRCLPADLEEYRIQERERLASEYTAMMERKLGA